MASDVCFELAGRRYCIPIYYEIPTWRRPIPPEELTGRVPSWIEVAGPLPDPWVNDLPVLATIADLAGQLRDEALRGQLAGMVNDLTAQVAKQLPEGFEVRTRQVG